MIKVPNFPVVIHSLADYAEVLRPFCDRLLEDGGEKFSLGPDNEKGKLDIWEADDPIVMMAMTVFDGLLLDFADTIHPRFRGKGKNYALDRDAWLNSPTSWQGTRIHRHWEPFLRPEDIGDLVTVFYPMVDDTIEMGNGHFELYRENDEGHFDHVWLPDDTEPVYFHVPKQYDLIIMTADTWHRARPFTGQRYSLATDVKLMEP